MLRRLSWNLTLKSLAVVEILIEPIVKCQRTYLVTTKCTDLQILGISIRKKSCQLSTRSFMRDFKKNHSDRHQKIFQVQQGNLLVNLLLFTSHQVNVYQRHLNLSLVIRQYGVQSLKLWTNSSVRQLKSTWISWSRGLSHNHLKKEFYPGSSSHRFLNLTNESFIL